MSWSEKAKISIWSGDDAKLAKNSFSILLAAVITHPASTEVIITQ